MLMDSRSFVEALVNLVIGGALFVGAVDLIGVVERVYPVNLGMEVPHGTSVLAGLRRL